MSSAGGTESEFATYTSLKPFRKGATEFRRASLGFNVRFASVLNGIFNSTRKRTIVAPKAAEGGGGKKEEEDNNENNKLGATSLRLMVDRGIYDERELKQASIRQGEGKTKIRVKRFARYTPAGQSSIDSQRVLEVDRLPLEGVKTGEEFGQLLAQCYTETLADGSIDPLYAVLSDLGKDGGAGWTNYEFDRSAHQLHDDFTVIGSDEGIQILSDLQDIGGGRRRNPFFGDTVSSRWKIAPDLARGLAQHSAGQRSSMEFSEIKVFEHKIEGHPVLSGIVAVVGPMYPVNGACRGPYGRINTSLGLSFFRKSVPLSVGINVMENAFQHAIQVVLTHESLCMVKLGFARASDVREITHAKISPFVEVHTPLRSSLAGNPRAFRSHVFTQRKDRRTFDQAGGVVMNRVFNDDFELKEVYENAVGMSDKYPAKELAQIMQEWMRDMPVLEVRAAINAYVARPETHSYPVLFEPNQPFADSVAWPLKCGASNVSEFIRSQVAQQFHLNLLKQVVFAVTMDCLRMHGAFGPHFGVMRNYFHGYDRINQLFHESETKLSADANESAVPGFPVPPRSNDLSGAFYASKLDVYIRSIMLMWHHHVGTFPTACLQAGNLTDLEVHQARFGYEVLLGMLLAHHYAYSRKRAKELGVVFSDHARALEFPDMILVDGGTNDHHTKQTEADGSAGTILKNDTIRISPYLRTAQPTKSDGVLTDFTTVWRSARVAHYTDLYEWKFEQDAGRLISENIEREVFRSMEADTDNRAYFDSALSRISTTLSTDIPGGQIAFNAQDMFCTDTTLNVRAVRAHIPVGMKTIGCVVNLGAAVQAVWPCWEDVHARFLVPFQTMAADTINHKLFKSPKLDAEEGPFFIRNEITQIESGILRELGNFSGQNTASFIENPAPSVRSLSMSIIQPRKLHADLRRKDPRNASLNGSARISCLRFSHCPEAGRGAETYKAFLERCRTETLPAGIDGDKLARTREFNRVVPILSDALAKNTEQTKNPPNMQIPTFAKFDAKAHGLVRVKLDMRSRVLHIIVALPSTVKETSLLNLPSAMPLGWNAMGRFGPLVAARGGQGGGPSWPDGGWTGGGGGYAPSSSGGGGGGAGARSRDHSVPPGAGGSDVYQMSPARSTAGGGAMMDDQDEFSGEASYLRSAMNQLKSRFGARFHRYVSQAQMELYTEVFDAVTANRNWTIPDFNYRTIYDAINISSDDLQADTREYMNKCSDSFPKAFKRWFRQAPVPHWDIPASELDNEGGSGRIVRAAIMVGSVERWTPFTRCVNQAVPSLSYWCDETTFQVGTLRRDTALNELYLEKHFGFAGFYDANGTPTEPNNGRLYKSDLQRVYESSNWALICMDENGLYQQVDVWSPDFTVDHLLKKPYFWMNNAEDIPCLKDETRPVGNGGGRGKSSKNRIQLTDDGKTSACHFGGYGCMAFPPTYTAKMYCTRSDHWFTMYGVHNERQVSAGTACTLRSFYDDCTNHMTLLSGTNVLPSLFNVKYTNGQDTNPEFIRSVHASRRSKPGIYPVVNIFSGTITVDEPPEDKNTVLAINSMNLCMWAAMLFSPNSYPFFTQIFRNNRGMPLADDISYARCAAYLEAAIQMAFSCRGVVEHLDAVRKSVTDESRKQDTQTLGARVGYVVSQLMLQRCEHVRHASADKITICIEGISRRWWAASSLGDTLFAYDTKHSGVNAVFFVEKNVSKFLTVRYISDMEFFMSILSFKSHKKTNVWPRMQQSMDIWNSQLLSKKSLFPVPTILDAYPTARKQAEWDRYVVRQTYYFLALMGAHSTLTVLFNMSGNLNRVDESKYFVCFFAFAFAIVSAKLRRIVSMSSRERAWKQAITDPAVGIQTPLRLIGDDACASFFTHVVPSLETKSKDPRPSDVFKHYKWYQAKLEVSNDDISAEIRLRNLDTGRSAEPTDADRGAGWGSPVPDRGDTSMSNADSPRINATGGRGKPAGLNKPKPTALRIDQIKEGEGGRTQSPGHPFKAPPGSSTPRVRRDTGPRTTEVVQLVGKESPRDPIPTTPTSARTKRDTRTTQISDDDKAQKISEVASPRTSKPAMVQRPAIPKAPAAEQAAAAAAAEPQQTQQAQGDAEMDGGANAVTSDPTTIPLPESIDDDDL